MGLSVVRRILGSPVRPERGQTPITIDSRAHLIVGWTPDDQAWISAAVGNVTRHGYCQLNEFNVSGLACEIKWLPRIYRRFSPTYPFRYHLPHRSRIIVCTQTGLDKTPRIDRTLAVHDLIRYIIYVAFI
jgi:hypothetical protein